MSGETLGTFFNNNGSSHNGSNKSIHSSSSSSSDDSVCMQAQCIVCVRVSTRILLLKRAEKCYGNRQRCERCKCTAQNEMALVFLIKICELTCVKAHYHDSRALHTTTCEFSDCYFCPVNNSLPKFHIAWKSGEEVERRR